MPNIHAAIVHYPIALFTAGFIVCMVGYILRMESLKSAGTVMVLLGAISAVVANLAGHEAKETVEKFLSEDGKEVLEDHETFGNITAFILPAAAALNLLGTVFLRERKSLARAFAGLYIAAGILGFILLVATGEKGGHLVYQHGAGVKSQGEHHHPPD